MYSYVMLCVVRRINMDKYEQISKKCKILWKENFIVTTEKYMQVSGYIFNEDNQLLIVKKDETWTIPGGHPERYETSYGTLVREVMEEACVTLKDIKYLGSVEVLDNDEKYYQMRYTAKTESVLPFVEEFEINERKFVDLKDLNQIITWSDGITFNEQIKKKKKSVGIK